jgi:hypothetical protein
MQSREHLQDLTHVVGTQPPAGTRSSCDTHDGLRPDSNAPWDPFGYQGDLCHVPVVSSPVTPGLRQAPVHGEPTPTTGHYHARPGVRVSLLYARPNVASNNPRFSSGTRGFVSAEIPTIGKIGRYPSQMMWVELRQIHLGFQTPLASNRLLSLFWLDARHLGGSSSISVCRTSSVSAVAFGLIPTSNTHENPKLRINRESPATASPSTTKCNLLTLCLKVPCDLFEVAGSVGGGLDSANVDRDRWPLYLLPIFQWSAAGQSHRVPNAVAPRPILHSNRKMEHKTNTRIYWGDQKNYYVGTPKVCVRVK